MISDAGVLDGACGRRVLAVEHDVSEDGEAISIEFEGGGALLIAGDELFAHTISPLAFAYAAMMDANPEPADGCPLVTVTRGAMTIDKFGGTYSMTKHELPWWMPGWLSLALFAVRHPWRASRSWWESR